MFRPNDISPEKQDLVRRHQAWLGTIQKEYPLPETAYRIGVYIRYFNQTKYENYLDVHKKQFEDTIALCPRWTLVGFYVDTGSVAPNMESAPEWCRLLADCFAGKVDLVITQKVSNVSRKAWDLTLIIRMLMARGVGIYFVSENIFTAASYYRHDMFDHAFGCPDPDPLPEGDEGWLLSGGEDAE